MAEGGRVGLQSAGLQTVIGLCEREYFCGIQIFGGFPPPLFIGK